MSISYCEKHDISHDEDHQTECPKCETESIESESNPNSLENLLNATGWEFYASGTNQERAKAKAQRSAKQDFENNLDPDPTRHDALLTSAFASWYLDEFNLLQDVTQ